MDIRSVSASTPIGACAFNEYGFSRPLIDTKGLEIPSWEADVGTLTKGIRRLLEIIFAMSTDLPPPMPIKKSGLLARILFCNFLRAPIDADGAICHESVIRFR